MKITPAPSGFRSRAAGAPDSMTNAGGPPRWDSKLPHPGADLCTQWAYRVNREHADPDRTMLCWGTREAVNGDTPESIATLVAGQQRAAFPTYAGPLEVAVWTLWPEDHYRRPVPAHARWFGFAPGTPDIPEPEPCEHGHLDYCAHCDG